MTVGELIRFLEDHDMDTEVRLAQQPSYPFEYSIGYVTEPINNIIYIGEENQIGYLPKEAKDELGW